MFTAPWSDPDGQPAAHGRGEDRVLEVDAQTGARHCEWESVVFLYVAWPPGAAWEPGDDFERTVRTYVRDPDGVFDGQDLVPDTLDRDVELPHDAADSGYHNDHVELWFGPDEGDRFAYLVTPDGVERWPRPTRPIGCA